MFYKIQSRKFHFLSLSVEAADSPWEKPSDTTLFTYILRWPITFCLWLTLPDCRKHPRLVLLTFIMCIVWIGLSSYTVAMAITIIGTTLNFSFKINDINHFLAFKFHR